MKEMITVKGLIKRYGKNEVLHGVNFNVHAGEIFGLLGVNGAGKTTTVECLEGLRKYDAGKIEIRGKIGIQLQTASLPEYIKVKEAIHLFANWNHTTEDKAQLHALGVSHLSEQYYGKLSTGQKRRVHLALALLREPDILFLDEPSAGLDVEGRVSFHEQIRLLREKGKTIVLASHDMAEVETLCDRIAILSQGKIVFAGTIDQLHERVGRQYQVVIQSRLGKEEYQCENVVDSLLASLQKYKTKKIEIKDMRVTRGTLEQHFLNLMKGEQE